MKYGAQLSGRSVPEWRSHNIQYNELKHEIKLITQSSKTLDTPPKSKAALDRLFFQELENISLFVKSKRGEIDFKINMCESLVEAALKQPPSPPTLSVNSISALSPTSIPPPDHVIDQTRLYQLRQEVAKLTQDIQRLSRFIGAQHTGFWKLIKKYRKWSGDPKILSKFAQKLQAPNSFVHVDLTPYFLELSLLYDIIRTGKAKSLKTEEVYTKGDLSPADKLCNFDVSLVKTPTESLKFWIHNDFLMEIKVFLLKVMSLVNNNTESSGQQISHVSYLDTPDFDYVHSDKEPGQIRSVEILAQDGQSLRDRSKPVLCAHTGGIRHFAAKALTPELENQIATNSLTQESLDSDTAGKLALGWVLNRNLKIIGEIDSERSRFEADDRDDSAGNLWATIDTGIRIVGCDSPDAEMPHSLLDIRWTSGFKPDWIKELQDSNLVYPLGTFSLLYWMAMIKYPDVANYKPHWMDVLQQKTDIRRAPMESELPRQRSLGNLHRKSRGILITDQSSGGDVTEYTPPTHRYWNEFDHPDTDDDDLVDVLDLDPLAHNRPLLADRLSQPIVEIAKKVHDGVTRFKHILRIPSSPESISSVTRSSDFSGERQSLLEDVEHGQYSPRLRPKPYYDSNLEAGRVYTSSQSDRSMVIISIISFTISIALIVFSLGILINDNIKDLPWILRIAATLGLTISLLFSALGVVAFNLRSSVPWSSQVAIQAVWFSVVCFGVGGIAWTLSG